MVARLVGDADEHEHDGNLDQYADDHGQCCAGLEAEQGDGNRDGLPGIHFVRVYTGVNQYCGWLGETSTEVQGANDLHLLGGDVDDTWGTTAVHAPSAIKHGADGYYMLDGISVAAPTRPGIYLHRKAGKVRKVLVR